MINKQKRLLRETFMQREGDTLACWLNDHPQSRLANHVAWFAISRGVIPAAQDTSRADFELRLQEAYKLKKAARACAKRPKEKARAVRFFNPARPYSLRIHLDFRTAVEHPLARLILPAGTQGWRAGDDWIPGDPILRILPVGSTDSAMLLLIKLAGARQLHRLRACAQCGRWLFARRGIQKFCAQRCREKFFESRDSWRQRRKFYMRQYRADLRVNPNVKVGENRSRGDQR
jgi:hypothetical protein